MKIKRTLLFTPLILTSFLLTGCLSRIINGLFPSNSSQTSSQSGGKSSSSTLDSNDDPSYNPSASSLNKTHLSYTYKDYMTNNAYDLDDTPLQGNPKLLIVPVWFTDSDTYIPTGKKAQVRDDIRKAYLGSDSETGWKSVRMYYHQLSLGKLKLNGVVTDWYECGKSVSKFTSDSTGGSNTMSLVTSAVDWYKSKSGDSTMKSFDADGNGYLDGVILIYGAPDYGTLKKNSWSNLWAYCYWLQGNNKNTSAPNPNVFFWASYDFMYGDKSVTDYYAGDTSHCKIDTHTFIHEMGHVLGLEDYYDYSNQYNPAGGFSMQDYNVGSHDPYSVMAYGWADPCIPTATTTLTLKPFQDNRDLVLLTNKSSVNSPFSEYLLVELYTPTGLNEFDSTYQYEKKYPKGPTEPGIRVWHVDARLVKMVGSSASPTFYTEPDSSGHYTHSMSNTYWSSDVEGYCSPLGESYANYNILQLIRNNKTIDYQPTGDLSSSDLFKQGDTFSMDTYSKQFVNSGKMNDNKVLGWSFKVKSLSSTGATIEFTKG